MTKAEKILKRTGCVNVAQATDERIRMDAVCKRATEDFESVALDVMTFFDKAIADGKITDRDGGFFSVPHFLKRFESIPADLESTLFDRVSRATLSAREANWVAVKEYVRIPYAGRTTIEIQSKRKNGKGETMVIPFGEINFEDKYEVEAAKLVVRVSARRGWDAGATVKFIETEAE